MGNIKKILGENTNISVENINKYISQQGVVVRISIGGGNNSYRISPKIYGIKEDKLIEEGNIKEFFDDHVRNGSIVFVPKHYKEKLNSIESKIRGKVRELSIGYNNSFIPISSYPEFIEYFENCREEFFEVRDELVEKYSFMCHRFINIARKSLEDLDAKDAREELEKIISKLPSKEKFSDSFRFDKEVSAFPIEENITLFDNEEIIEEIKKTTEKTSNNLIIDSTINIINEGMTSLSAVIKSAIDSGKIHQRSMYGLKNSIKKMGVKNIFANPKLDKIKSEMSEIPLTDDDSAVELAEKLLAELYNYSVELGIENEIDLEGCLLSRKRLMEIYEFYNNNGVGA